MDVSVLDVLKAICIGADGRKSHLWAPETQKESVKVCHSPHLLPDEADAQHVESRCSIWPLLPPSEDDVHRSSQADGDDSGSVNVDRRICTS